MIPSGVDMLESAHAARSDGLPTEPAIVRPRVAAIDVGSSSIRLVIAEVEEDGSTRIVAEDRRTTRLASGLVSTGRMDEAAMELSAWTIARMCQRARLAGVKIETDLRAVATSAVRDAANRRQFVELVRTWARLDLEVISGEREGLYAFNGLLKKEGASTPGAAADALALIDIGGGSAQIVVGASGRGGRSHAEAPRAWSMPIGAVRMTEKFGGPRAIGEDDAAHDALASYVREVFATTARPMGEASTIVYATAGTPAALAEIELARRGEVIAPTVGVDRRAKLQGFELTRASVARSIRELRQSRLEDRLAGRFPGLAPERGDVIVAGAVILDAAMEALGARAARVHAGGVRAGVIAELAHEVTAREVMAGDARAGHRAGPHASEHAPRHIAGVHTRPLHGSHSAATNGNRP